MNLTTQSTLRVARGSVAWTHSTVRGKSLGEDPLSGGIARWQKDFTKGHESDFALSEFQYWEYSLAKIAVGCITDRLFLNYSRQFQECSRQQKQQEKQSQSYKLSKLHSQILRHSHVADLDSSLHLSIHQVAAFTEPGLGSRPYSEVDAARPVVSSISSPRR